MTSYLQLIVVVLCLGLAAPTMAQAETGANSGEIRGIISEQIDAFLKDDFEKAFEFASPTIRRMFGTSEKFGNMVRDSYPMVWRPADMFFGDLKKIEGKTFQTVYLTDAAGKHFEAAYEMVKTTDGWQINGVFIREVDMGV